MTARILIAGVGNLFLGDDGFGPEVVRHLLAGPPLPPGAHATDYGIRGVHLTYDLLDPWDALIMIDALPAMESPGELVVLEISADTGPLRPVDAHGMDPMATLAAVTRLGGTLPPSYLVGCRINAAGESIGLSAAVTAAVPQAAHIVRTLASRLAQKAAATTGRP
ncbi:hydrogenase maturation protease [Actinoplanes sp. NPDC051851]|uniref:hydrogenase maturation protease n=1 Tax=Actinoplanes sp. NPDC051851 TaxID=3154753 RepID=UPI00341480AE